MRRSPGNRERTFYWGVAALFAYSYFISVYGGVAFCDMACNGNAVRNDVVVKGITTLFVYIYFTRVIGSLAFVILPVAETPFVRQLADPFGAMTFHIGFCLIGERMLIPLVIITQYSPLRVSFFKDSEAG